MSDGLAQRPYDPATQTQVTASATTNAETQLLPAPKKNYRWAITAILIDNSAATGDSIQLKDGSGNSYADFGPVSAPASHGYSAIVVTQPIRGPKDKPLSFAATTGQNRIAVTVLAFQEEAV